MLSPWNSPPVFGSADRDGNGLGVNIRDQQIVFDS